MKKKCSIILFYGLRRSGNHAILNQLIPNHKNYVHINDTYLSTDKFIEFSKVRHHSTYSESDYIGFNNTDKAILSIENQIPNFEDISFIQSNFGKCQIFLLLRNPYNHLSSAWSCYNKNKKETNLLKELWIHFAELFLQLELENKNNIVRILYDKFFTDKDYREKLYTMNIGMETQPDLESHLKWGYSSFKKSLKQKKMWGLLPDSNYGEDSEFTKFFDDQKINDLWNKILVSKHVSQNII